MSGNRNDGNSAFSKFVLFILFMLLLDLIQELNIRIDGVICLCYSIQSAEFTGFINTSHNGPILLHHPTILRDLGDNIIASKYSVVLLFTP